METIIVYDEKHPNGSYVINTEDFDEKKHSKEPKKTTKSKKANS
jgi:hypothetical protein